MLKSWTKSAIFGKEYKLNCLSCILCGFLFFVYRVRGWRVQVEQAAAGESWEGSPSGLLIGTQLLFFDTGTIGTVCCSLGVGLLVRERTVFWEGVKFSRNWITNSCSRFGRQIVDWHKVRSLRGKESYLWLSDFRWKHLNLFCYNCFDFIFSEDVCRKGRSSEAALCAFSLGREGRETSRMLPA